MVFPYFVRCWPTVAVKLYNFSDIYSNSSSRFQQKIETTATTTRCGFTIWVPIRWNVQSFYLWLGEKLKSVHDSKTAPTQPIYKSHWNYNFLFGSVSKQSILKWKCKFQISNYLLLNLSICCERHHWLYCIHEKGKKALAMKKIENIGHLGNSGFVFFWIWIGWIKPHLLDELKANPAKSSP